MFRKPPAHLRRFYKIVRHDYGSAPGYQGWICLPLPQKRAKRAKRFILTKPEWFSQEFLPKGPTIEGLNIWPYKSWEPLGYATLGDQLLCYKHLRFNRATVELCYSLLASMFGVGAQVYDFWFQEGIPGEYVMLMEYLEGGTIPYKQEKKMAHRMDLMVHRAGGLTGIWHRDLHGANFMLHKGVLKLIDWESGYVGREPGAKELPVEDKEISEHGSDDDDPAAEEVFEVSEEKQQQYQDMTRLYPPSFRKVSIGKRAPISYDKKASRTEKIDF